MIAITLSVGMIAASLLSGCATTREKEEAGAIYESYIEDFTNLDGTVNWLPICATGDGMVANQELFEEYNIPLPTDYASFVSACNAFDEEKKEAYRCGMNGFISKPIVIDEVIQELGKIF